MLHGRRSKVAVPVYKYGTSDARAMSSYDHIGQYGDIIEIEGCGLGQCIR